MHHRKSGRVLGRKTAHRQALYRNLSISLIDHEIIKTTVPKAKELRRFLERLITMSKVDTVANRRLVFARLRNKQAVSKLFEVLGPRYNERPGGYTQVIKAGYRAGDSAPVAYIGLMDRTIKRTADA